MTKVVLPDTPGFRFAKHDSHVRNEFFPDWTLCGLAHSEDVQIVGDRPSCMSCRLVAKQLNRP
jgi:hypothetical protein